MILVDGTACDTVPVSDRGLAYGDGLFETIALVDGRPRHWDRHYARLHHGADRLGIACPEAALWLEDLQSLQAATADRRAVLKLTLTRGSGPRGYRPPLAAAPRRIVQVDPWAAPAPALARDGIRAMVCATRLGRNPLLAGLKHLNRLEQVLANRELAAAGFDEGLMLDDRGHVVSGTRTNLLVVRHGGLQTPTLAECGVAGVMRSVILDLARALAIATQEVYLGLEEIQAADELMFCNALIGIWPVAHLDGAPDREFRRRPMTERLQAMLTARGLAP